MVSIILVLCIVSSYYIQRSAAFSPRNYIRNKNKFQYQKINSANKRDNYSTFKLFGIINNENKTNNPIVQKDSRKLYNTQEELDGYAKSVGVKITFSTLGPGYRAVARADHDPEQILGYCEGFVRPGGKILHVDKCEVWKKALNKAKAENPIGFQNGGQVFGVSLLLGYTCMLHGQNQNCSVAEFLAIDDEAFQHKRLVRFFKRAGFKVVRYVGEELKDVPDRLVWGGCGTLMKQDISTLLDRWSKVLQ